MPSLNLDISKFDLCAERDALDILWSLMGADNYRLFVTERGWPPERYEKWLTATLKTLLLRKAPSMLSHE